MSKISMLPNPIVDEPKASPLYRIWKHTNFRHWTRPSLNKGFSITYVCTVLIQEVIVLFIRLNRSNLMNSQCDTVD